MPPSRKTIQKSMTKHISILLVLLSLAGKASAQFGVTDEQFDSIQAARDSLQVVLGEASVAAKKRTIKAEIDKMVYSVTDDPEAATQTLTEMLRKVPMVTVDGEDNIKVNGQSGFKVYVNGKPNQMMSNNPKEIFKSYPASAVKKIEVITDPGAKYDAEGVSGILNIVTLSETVTKGWTVTPRLNVNNQGYGGGFFGTVQYGKFTVSANYGFGVNDWSKSTSNYSSVQYEEDTKFNLLEQGGSAKPNVFYNFGGLEASYEFSAHDLLSVSAGVFGHKYDFDAIGTANMWDVDRNPVYSYNRRIILDNNSMNYNAGADYQHTFASPEQALTFSYRYNGTPSNNKQRLETLNIAGAEFLPTLTDQDIDPDYHSTEHTIQADFSTPFGKEHQLSVGGKYIRRINESDSKQFDKPTAGTESGEWTLNDAASLHYRHLGGIAAAYAEYVLKLQKFSLRGGLRYEHSHVNVEYPDGKRPGFVRNFDNLLPSLNLGYNLSALQMLKFSYSFRIQRPNISQLSPYTDTSKPGFASYGNPRLESEEGHSFGFDYNLFDTKFSIALNAYFNFSNNGLTNYTFIDRQQCLNTTYDNFLHRRSGNLSAYINWNISPHTSLSINGSGGYTDLSVDHNVTENEKHEAFHVSMHKEGWQAYGFANLRQDIWWNMKLGISAGGGLPWLSLQQEGSNWYFYNLSLSRSFLKEKRLELALNISNFCNPYRTYTSTSEGKGYVKTEKTRNYQMRFGISISWRLGKLQTSVKKARRTISNDDVAAPQSNSTQGDGQGAMGGK